MYTTGRKFLKIPWKNWLILLFKILMTFLVLDFNVLFQVKVGGTKTFRERM